MANSPISLSTSAIASDPFDTIIDVHRMLQCVPRSVQRCARHNERSSILFLPVSEAARIASSESLIVSLKQFQ